MTIINLVSFGHRFGDINDDNFVVYDVRKRVFDPFQIALNKTGLDKDIAQIILARGGNIFIENLLKEITLQNSKDSYGVLISRKSKESLKSQINIAIKCIGGRHRSVAIVEELYDRLKILGYENITKHHRDIDK